jgi:hypothetical protein
MPSENHDWLLGLDMILARTVAFMNFFVILSEAKALSCRLTAPFKNDSLNLNILY